MEKHLWMLTAAALVERRVAGYRLRSNWRVGGVPHLFINSVLGDRKGQGLVDCKVPGQVTGRMPARFAPWSISANWLWSRAGCAGAGPHIEGKIAVVDPARTLNESNAGKKAKDTLAAFSKNRQALIELEEKELRRMEDDFIKQASVLSPTAKKERE